MADPAADRGVLQRGMGTAGAAGLLVLLLGAAPAAAAAQERPDGVTEETVDRGRRLYLGDGFCHTCHGRDGEGLPDLGTGLTSGTWTYSDGTLEGLARVIREGVPAETSRTGIPMPPCGGAHLDPEQLRAVAAYVWTLSRGGRGGGR